MIILIHNKTIVGWISKLVGSAAAVRVKIAFGAFVNHSLMLESVLSSFLVFPCRFGLSIRLVAEFISNLVTIKY